MAYPVVVVVVPVESINSCFVVAFLNEARTVEFLSKFLSEHHHYNFVRLEKYIRNVMYSNNPVKWAWNVCSAVALSVDEKSLHVTFTSIPSFRSLSSPISTTL